MQLAVCAAALCALCGVSSAGLVVANDQSGVASIYDIDVNTGVATPIYSGSGPEAKAWGMAYDPGSNMLFWNNGGNLYRSTYGPTLTPSAALAMTYNGSSVNFVSLAWRNGKLLGTRNITTEAVYEIDVDTGVATLIYQYPTAFDFGGLDTDVTTNTLYGLSDNGPAGFYRFDLSIPTHEFLFGYPAGEIDIDGLAVHAGRAYFVTDGPNTVQANFYVYDIASGTQIGTIPSPFTGSGTFSAATFVPAPGAAAVFGLGALAGVRRRR